MQHMTVTDRDQYEILKTDWSPLYDISHCPGRDHPFLALPRTSPETVIDADSPAQLRDRIRADHATRVEGAGQ
jgi:hypothetical protein